ncbi:hypothetical protein KUCAC02_025148 [Chaenocephalus aceratus]|nr:hypothetical protein KUCAC02_025148 [Chaenocephalus aceratus]
MPYYRGTHGTSANWETAPTCTTYRERLTLTNAQRVDSNLNTFVRGDTLLGEHIYHSHVLHRTCPYITQRFLGMEQELMLTIGRER